MRKLVAMVAVAAGLMMGSAANAATFDVFLNQTTATDWELVVNNNSGSVGIGAINVITTGLQAMVLNAANLNIDTTLSGFNPDADGEGRGSIAINNTAPGVSIVAAGAQGSLLASLTGLGPVTGNKPDGDPFFDSPGLFDANGAPIDTLEWSLTVVPTPVPEPTAMVLVGLGLAALSMVRRSA